ncbi:trypsin-like serine protease [Pyxidicoccus trucidator]|uniref:trypsin-like serine protease n=1 Tax=Pyxidicoccus trucidator TaxID=2709662 RepID=UPI001F0839BF|nr:trypsin-like serine protease [Pyxidicoccus trucidator]
MPHLMSSLLVPFQGAIARCVPRRQALVGMMSLLVGCGSQAVVEPPPQEPAPSSEQEIVNGTDTTMTANPWQVQVWNPMLASAAFVCGGTILNEHWVLTAQHCVRDSQQNLITPRYVVAGNTSTISVDAPTQVVAVDRVFPYPGYVGTSQGKDVALLRLATPLDLSGPYVKAIPLATVVDESSRVTAPGVVARATGWGRRYVDGPQATTLQTTDLILQSHSVAQAAYPEYVITPDQLAASALGTGTCDGDSGGPLTVPYGDTRVLAGIVSWGRGCGDSRYPSMFARVSQFEPWIKSMTCTLANGVAQPDISVGQGQWTCSYTLEVPAGASGLAFELSGGTGDGELYVKFGSEPTAGSFDCKSVAAGNQEKCPILNPRVGTWYAKVYGYAGSSGMRLKGGYAIPLDFGGMWGYVDGGVLVPHPTTHTDTCPAGYKPTRLLGSDECPGCDWDVFVCTRPRQNGREPLYDFGGMWGYVNGVVMPNPYTFAASCPEGYTDQRVLGTLNVDYEVHACYKPHVPGTTPDFPFGGMMGQVDSGTVAPNPATGAATCPPGFVVRPVSGYPNVDWSLHFCYQPPDRWDFGGMSGYVDGGWPSYNPATGSDTCPTGYTKTQLLGTTGVDLKVYLCSRPHLASTETYFDFGGMYGYARGVPVPNPYTNAASCPYGYTARRVLGTPGRDADLYYCYQRHMSKSPPTYPFGGMWGQVDGGRYVPNPATGGLSCPSGFTDKQVLGTGGLDYELHFCSTMP